MIHILTAAVLTTMLGGCMANAEKTPQMQASCRPEQAEQLVGLVNPTDQQIMEMTGASEVRRAMEGDMMTMEFLPFRATVVMDKSSGKVIGPVAADTARGGHRPLQRRNAIRGALTPVAVESNRQGRTQPQRNP